MAQLTTTTPSNFKLELSSAVRLYELGLKPYYRSVVNVMPTDLYIETVGTKSDLPRATLHTPMQPVETAVRTMPYKLTLTQQIRRIGFRLEKVAQRADLHGVANPAEAAELMRLSIMRAKEYAAAAMYDLGFLTPGAGGTNTADNVALFSAAHPLASGTFSNLVTGSPLGIASLENARTIAMSQKTHVGEVMYSPEPMTLVVPPALALLAKRLVNSDLRPQTADNDKNVVADTKLVVNPFLASSTNWYLIPSDAKKNPLLMKELIPIDSDWSDEGAATYSELWAMSTVFATGAVDWRKMVGVQA